MGCNHSEKWAETACCPGFSPHMQMERNGDLESELGTSCSRQLRGRSHRASRTIPGGQYEGQCGKCQKHKGPEQNMWSHPGDSHSQVCQATTQHLIIPASEGEHTHGRKGVSRHGVPRTLPSAQLALME